MRSTAPSSCRYCSCPRLGGGKALRQLVYGAKDFEETAGAEIVLFDLQVLGQVDHQGDYVDAGVQLGHPFGYQVQDGRGSLVGAAPTLQPAAVPSQADPARISGDQQGSGVRHSIVHASQTAVAADAEVLEHLQHRVRVVLALGMGLHEVEEQVVGAVLGLGVLDGAVGYFHLTVAVLKAHGRPVPGEVEEPSRPGELAQLDGAKVVLQGFQCDGADAAYIDPRTDHDQGVGRLEFRQGTVQFKGPNSHRSILSERSGVFK